MKPPQEALTLAQFGQLARAIEDEVGKVIVGQADVVRSTLICIIAARHALLEGVPGLGKTMLVRTLANVLDLDFNRIQFTPDLMPADIIGTDILEESPDGKRDFRFQKGAISMRSCLSLRRSRARCHRA